MLQVLATPTPGQLSVESPAWHKAASQKRLSEASDLVGWFASLVLMLLIVAGALAVLVAEYGLLWAVLVAPWLDRLPLALPWTY